MFFFRESVFNVRYTVESSSISITSSTHSTLEQSSVTAALQVTVCKKKINHTICRRNFSPIRFYCYCNYPYWFKFKFSKLSKFSKFSNIVKQNYTEADMN